MSFARSALRAIRPLTYRHTSTSRLTHPMAEPGSLVTEIRFEDDPRMTRDWRDRSRREGCLICEVKRGADKIQRATANFQLRSVD